MKNALVLEGGGLRGVYTVGVLDAFNDNNIEFEKIYGVSAGALNAVSYMTKQRGRNLELELTYIGDKRYMSIGNIFKTGYLFGHEMMFHLIPDELLPFDYDAFRKCNTILYATATDCVTGETKYFEVPKELKGNYDTLKATSSLPFVSRFVEIDGHYYLDGGMTDSIPIKHSIDEGNRKNVVVVTRDKSYRKKPASYATFTKLKYRKYPMLVKAILNRYVGYNETLDFINEKETNDEIFLIRPSRPLDQSRFEKDTDKLKQGYDLGFEDTMKRISELKDYLE